MSKPVSRLVTYRPKPNHHAELEALLKQHGTVLKKTGLITAEPVRVFTATDLTRGGGGPPPYFVELFQWRDAEASELAHQMPEVMAVWETMGPHVATMTLTTLEPVS